MPAVQRHAQAQVIEALTDTRIVALQGARQVGKTTLVRTVVEQQHGRLVTLDDAATRAAAETDPSGFLLQFPDGLLAIDEVQRVPELLLALKLIVDRDPRPGRYLVTGSADLTRLPTVEDSLAGRVEDVELLGFSQGEIAGHREQFIDRLFAGDRLLGYDSSLTRADYLRIAVAGSYPEALARADRRRSAWLDTYLARIVERDAADASGSRRVADLPLILRTAAARNAQELNLTDIAGATGIPATSVGRLIELLEILYLLQRIPAWSTNLTKRVVSRPKVAVLDSGLAARLAHVTDQSARVDRDPTAAGHLLEGFVAGELRKQLGWSHTRVTLSHYRDRTGAEVDLILESDDGRIAAIEVKAASTVQQRDVRWLARLRDQLRDRFAAGVVLYTGQASLPFGERLSAVPLQSLWIA